MGELEVTARSLVEVLPTTRPDPSDSPPWEKIRDDATGDRLDPSTEAGAFRFSSPLVPQGEDFAEYAKPDFSPGRPILEAVTAFTHRIFTEFEFDPKATDLSTPVRRSSRKGRESARISPTSCLPVCARSACPRDTSAAIWKPVRPPARHAWSAPTHRTPGYRSSAERPSAGWMRIQPTTCCPPSATSPSHGGGIFPMSAHFAVSLSGAGGQALTVEVDVEPLE